MKKLFLDNIEFLPYKLTSEDELVNFIYLNIKDIFGTESIYFEKRKIKAISGIGSIPDGYLIALRDNRWFIVEVELSSHPLYEHIVPQISKFISGISNPDMRQKLVDYFYKTIKHDIMLENLVKQVIGSGEIYRFISNIVSQKPELIIIIDEYTQELKEVRNTLPINSTIVEFKTFQRVGVETIFAFLFDSLIKYIPPKEREFITPPPPPSKRKRAKGRTRQGLYRLPILEALIEMGGRGAVQDVLNIVKDKMKQILKPIDYEEISSGIRWQNTAQWERLKMVKENLLRPNSPRGIWEITEEGHKFYKINK
ncbi:hypothetical protein ES702_02281 [subsurface metagenome]